MSDVDNAGYRLLSFKYTPTKPVERDDQAGANDKSGHHNHNKARTPPPTSRESELPSLASLAEALPVVDDTFLSNKQDGPSVADTDTDTGTEAETATDAEGNRVPGTGPPVPSFHLFGDLPPELRIKIWHLTFLPRVVELHPTRPFYARDIGRQQQWQSGCSNPAALSVCSEARQIALGHFRIAYPLAAIAAQQETQGPFVRYVAEIGTYNFSGANTNGKASLRRRTLRISPDNDTVALLGQDTDFAKLSRLLDSFRDADPQGLGIGSLALSTRGWGHGGSAAMMRSLDRSILRDLDQLTLFMYGDPLPPSEWKVKGACLDEESLRWFREAGNRCELVPCECSNAWYAYRLWSGGKGRQFWDNDGKIMRVGRNELKIMDLKFSDGW